MNMLFINLKIIYVKLNHYNDKGRGNVSFPIVKFLMKSQETFKRNKIVNTHNLFSDNLIIDIFFFNNVNIEKGNFF